MKAKIEPRIELHNRTDLRKVIPLATPFHIFVDPSDLCNFRCKFCPTGNRTLMKKVGRKPGLMRFGVFRKIVDDLRDFETPIKVLRLYKDGEPLMNPHFSEMVRYAKLSGRVLQVDTTTNASLLSPKRNLEIIASGLDRINISLEGLSADKYREFAGYRLNFDTFVENIRHFYEHRKQCCVCIKIVGDNLSNSDKARFFSIFGDISDKIFIENVAPCWPTFEMAGITPNASVGIYGQAIKEVIVCPYIFYSFSINVDGKVSLCFLDWAKRLIVGDVTTDSLKNIWNGRPLYDYRKMHLSMKRKRHPICGNCGQLTHCLPDDIDSHAEALLRKLTQCKPAH